ncbi:MAG TPA: hypothetical protein VK907_08850, partial [Phnomibacter sp.]|nr:hypothetical protein [Phnomibacter sp.]
MKPRYLPYLDRKGLIGHKLVLFIFLTILCLGSNAQEWVRPEQEGGRWGIRSSGGLIYKKGSSVQEEKWLFKPQWDMVWIDSSRSGCSTGRNGCDGFITMKKGKYGYAWADGKVLPNEFEEIDMVRGRRVKKNGRWGGFQEHVQVLPFEYDDLVYCSNYQQQYGTGDGTTCLLYGTRQNGNWGAIAAIVSNGKLLGTEIVLPSSLEDFMYHHAGALVRRQGKWYFVDLQKRGDPQYSAAFDSIINLQLVFAVLKDGQWMPVLPGSNSPVTNS